MHAATGATHEPFDSIKVEASDQIKSSSPIKSADNKMRDDDNNNDNRNSSKDYCEFLKQTKVIEKGCTNNRQPTHIYTRSQNSFSAGYRYNYSYHHRKLLIPLSFTTTTIIIVTIIIALLMEIQQTNGAELSTQHKSSSSPATIQKRYGNSNTMDPSSSLTTNSEQQPPGQQIAAEQARRHMMSLAMADLMQKNNQQQQQQNQHQQRSLWSQDPNTHLMHQFKQPAINHNENEQQFVSYRPIVAASTMPTINRQIQPPNPFYELSFAPTNTLQLETTNNNNHHDSNNHHNNNNNNQHQHHHQLHQLDEQEPHFASAMSQPNPVRLDPTQQQSNSGISTTARSIELPQQQQSEAAIQMTAESAAASASTDSNKDAGSESGARNSQQQQQQQEQQTTAAAAAAAVAPAPVDKIEPRQRRRLFNRILKKAEWNHLFVELSKVFLRYFLDLALKDIIGKQSGSTSSGSGSSETTSRKKLDAQSELADLLKEIVKNAIAANF